ncbi:endonuclease/exonuclease/phosphatase family protein [Halovulum sp. GXIMD14794]
MRLLAAILLLLASSVSAETLRVATYNASLNRAGPGVLLKDLRAGGDPQIAAVVEVIRTVRPDTLLLNEIDYDGGLMALTALRDLLRDGGAGVDYPHIFAAPSNTGEPSGLDLDGDGKATGPGDAWGYGNFPGQYGMAVLSRYPIDVAATRTFRTFRWADLEGALLPVGADGEPFPSEAAHEAMRLSSKSHWDVAIEAPDGALHLLASHPTPPVFDGPEDHNGRRNHDEIRFWIDYLDGWAPTDDQDRAAHIANAPFVLLGDLNADPADGDGLKDVVARLLAHPAVQDPVPESRGAEAAGALQGGDNALHAGRAALDTADWRDEGGPGNLRVDYVLPAASLTVEGAGVHWPEPGAPGHEPAALASDHRLVWVDISLP